MSTLKDRALCERVTLPFDNSHLFSPEGRLRVITRPESRVVKRTPDGKSVELVYMEEQLTPRMGRAGVGFFATGVRLLEVALTGSPVLGTDTSTYTFTAANLGAADANRSILVGVAGQTTGAAAATPSVTVAGIAASADVPYNVGVRHVSIHRAAVPTGATGNVVVSSGSWLRCGIAVWRALNVTSLHDSATDVTTTTNANTVDCDTTDNCIGVGITYISAGAVRTHVWVGLTEDFDKAVEGTNYYSAASETITVAEAPRTISCTPNNTSTACITCAGIFI